ncbi:hypothetical protein FB446DRAFT_818119 [Lentinula raphanica]|nr:hypothetical protein FB446DRAFT_818119 [Lentinula raphanica]
MRQTLDSKSKSPPKPPIWATVSLTVGVDGDSYLFVFDLYSVFTYLIFEFSVGLEEQQLMNTLQSLKVFYTDVPCVYPNQLEMRIYHRLIQPRGQRERHNDTPPSILSHPLYQVTSAFRTQRAVNDRRSHSDEATVW